VPVKLVSRERKGGGCPALRRAEWSGSLEREDGGARM
jgi:hypothetical protein